MNRDEVRALLSAASSLDRWLKATDPETAQQMVEGWHHLLGEVPLDFAQGVVRRHYGTPDVRTMTPGDVLAAWDTQRRREEQAAVDAEVKALAAPVSVQDGIPVAGAGRYLHDLTAAIAEGRDPRSVQRPAGVRVLSPREDELSRRCRFHDLCACTHTECRDGWMDEETTVVGLNGRRYTAVQLCPPCRDAFLMAEERGRTKKPVGAAGRRR